MNWFLPSLGGLLVLAGMQDLFHTLFHPTEQGNISEFITLRIWRGFSRFAPNKRLMVGPLNFVTVILVWLLFTVLGFALIYQPFLPNAFVVAPGMDASQLGSFIASIDLSLSSLITVSTGLRTNSATLQFLLALEAVLGFAILTASISWLLSIYPVIEHRRSLAHEIFLLHHTESTGIRRLEQMSDAELQELFLGLTSQISTIRTELSQFPITYYFQERDEKSPVAPALYYLSEIAEEMSAGGRTSALSATMLGGAIDDFLALVESKYLPRKSPDRWSTFRQLLADHGREPLQRPRPRKAA